MGELKKDFCGIKCTKLARSLNTVGMKQKKSVQKAITAEEAKLIDRLRKHPEILERVQSILEIARNEDGPLKTADQVEELLVDEMRRLGSITMTQWATQAEERVSTELRSQDSTILSLKKKG